MQTETLVFRDKKQIKFISEASIKELEEWCLQIFNREYVSRTLGNDFVQIEMSLKNTVKPYPLEGYKKFLYHIDATDKAD